MKLKLMPYANVILRKLAQKYTLAIATSSEKWKMDIFYKRFPVLKETISVLITKEQITKSKQDPEIFLKAAKEVGAKPEKAIVIEDSINGLMAAKSGGFDCIIIQNPFLKKEEYAPYKPVKIINKLHEIIKIL